MMTVVTIRENAHIAAHRGDSTSKPGEVKPEFWRVSQRVELDVRSLPSTLATHTFTVRRALSNLRMEGHP